MKTMKKAIIGMSLTAGIAFVGMGFYNSMNITKTAFFENKLNIKFAKRLDEMTGQVVLGRMAASVPKFDAQNSLQKRVLRVGPKKTIKREIVKAEIKRPAQENVELPEPAVMDARGLVLTGGLYNKKPLNSKYKFSGNATVVDGVVEEVSVLLPDGAELNINTRERMVGNVFQYEDSETRETKSGLFYKVKDGQYMISLTDDTKFAGLRLEFKTEDAIAPSTSSWALNEQNPDNTNNQDQENIQDEYAQDDMEMKAREWEQKQEELTEQAFNQYDAVELDKEQVQNINTDMQRDSEQFVDAYQQS